MINTFGDAAVKRFGGSDIAIRKTAVNVVLVTAGVVYVTLLSQAAIPLGFTPVMLSLGTFAVMSTGAVLGSKRSVASLSIYAVLGFAGVPVFQGWKAGFGLATCGYVLGYIACAWIVGKLVEKKTNYIVTVLAGLTPVYILGVGFLMLALGSTDLMKGLELGFYPFLLGEVIKMIVVAGLIPGLNYGVKKFEERNL
jgi:biotin transport system substrate-specific component